MYKKERKNLSCIGSEDIFYQTRCFCLFVLFSSLPLIIKYTVSENFIWIYSASCRPVFRLWSTRWYIIGFNCSLKESRSYGYFVQFVRLRHNNMLPLKFYNEHTSSSPQEQWNVQHCTIMSRRQGRGLRRHLLQWVLFVIVATNRANNSPTKASPRSSSREGQ